jgi:hypothetical protein
MPVERSLGLMFFFVLIFIYGPRILLLSFALCRLTHTVNKTKTKTKKKKPFVGPNAVLSCPCCILSSIFSFSFAGELERVQGGQGLLTGRGAGVGPGATGGAAAGVATALAWAGAPPSAAVAVAGRADGSVACTHRTRGAVVFAEAGTAHTGAVRVAAVAPGGGLLVTGCDGGGLAVWACDGAAGAHGAAGAPQQQQQRRGGGDRNPAAADTSVPRLLHRVKKRGAVTHVVFRSESEFVAVTAAGQGYLGDDVGHVTEAFKVGRPALSVNYYAERDCVVVVTDDMVMSRFRFAGGDGGGGGGGGGNNALVREVKVKLAVTARARFCSAWVGNGVLATCAGETVVRVWSLGGRDNYILSHDDESFTSLAFNERTRTLATGTASGKVVLWRYLLDDDGSASTDTSWRAVTVDPSSGGHGAGGMHGDDDDGADGSGREPVTAIAFAPDDSAIAVIRSPAPGAEGATQGPPAPGELAVLAEAGRGAGLKGNLGYWRVGGGDAKLLRVAPSVHSVETDGAPTTSIPLRTTLNIRGLDADATHCLVWSGRKAEVYEVGDVACSIFATFPTRASAAAIGSAAAAPAVFLANSQSVDVCNTQGAPRTSLGFSQIEGEPEVIDAAGGFVVAASRIGVVEWSRRVFFCFFLFLFLFLFFFGFLGGFF